MVATRKSTDERLNESRKKFEQLKVQIAKLEERKRTEDRRADARRKIVVGAAVLAHAERDPTFKAALRSALKSAVSRDTDKQAIADLITG